MMDTAPAAMTAVFAIHPMKDPTPASRPRFGVPVFLSSVLFVLVPSCAAPTGSSPLCKRLGLETYFRGYRSSSTKELVTRFE
ncbi:hypothetical protein PAHAL_1G346700 [Panicum hallii]|uniref:Uncharacterized protein n=1 Tax=Panicum hallii TaxID=206008 RepID=A0A2T8KX90_9POAL|nr:hypothetical protein PAHAL_1G346700 [Panicum hallii]